MYKYLQRNEADLLKFTVINQKIDFSCIHINATMYKVSYLFALCNHTTYIKTWPLFYGPLNVIKHLLVMCGVFYKMH